MVVRQLFKAALETGRCTTGIFPSCPQMQQNSRLLLPLFSFQSESTQTHQSIAPRDLLCRPQSLAQSNAGHWPGSPAAFVWRLNASLSRHPSSGPRRPGFVDVDHQPPASFGALSLRNAGVSASRSRSFWRTLFSSGSNWGARLHRLATYRDTNRWIRSNIWRASCDPSPDGSSRR